MLGKIFTFYLTGFRQMRLGRTLWLIVLLKLIILFAVLKPMFFPDILQARYDTDAARVDHVLQSLTQITSTGTSSAQAVGHSMEVSSARVD